MDWTRERRRAALGLKGNCRTSFDTCHSSFTEQKYTCLKEVPVVRDRVYVLLEVEDTVWCSSGLQTVRVLDKKSCAVVKSLDAEKEVIKAMILVDNKPLQSDEELDMLRLMKLSSPRSKSKMTVVKMRKERGRIGPQTE